MVNTLKANNKWVVIGLFSLTLIVILQWTISLSKWHTIAILIVFICCTWLISRITTVETSKQNQAAADRFLSRNNARNVGLKLQGLGKLNLAFEKFKLCKHNHDTANLLYNLAIDFQIKGEPNNAKKTLLYISTFEPDFKDIQTRLTSFETQSISDKDSIDDLESTLISEPNNSKDIFADTIQQQYINTTKNITSSANLDKQTTTDLTNDYPQLYGSRYKVIELLGQGTTGAVFKGKDLTADKTVAIKVLNLTDELNPNDLEEYKFRFHREADTAGILDHPNIVKIYDSGETESFAYIVMEYVDGINLRHYARADNLLHPKSILKLIAQSADALAYAHKQDLIHRDIKPANILYNQSADYVKLTDFGIAKIPDSTRTCAGSILGTPLYMSPEQLAGGDLDARSDLYSLGVTLYHLLTGSPPFRPKTMAELLRSITHERHKDIVEINPNTPSCIAWAVNKALEKDPDKRFQSAASMANKLRECEMMLDS